MKIFTFLVVILLASISLNGQAQVTYFETRSEFHDVCPENDLTFEDFNGGPAGSSGCTGPVSDQGDDCFAAGEIESGFEVTTNIEQAGDILYIPAGSFGVNANAVGADVFPAHTILNFTDSNAVVNAVAFDLHSALGDGAAIKLTIFGKEGIIDSAIFNAPQDAPVFVGIQSTKAIISIELENLDLVLEHIALLSFGNCEAVSNVENVSFLDLDFYPNPIKNTLFLRNEAPIQEVTLLDMTGKELKAVNGSSNALDFEMTDFPSGVYFLKVVINNYTKTYKIIKE